MRIETTLNHLHGDPPKFADAVVSVDGTPVLQARVQLSAINLDQPVLESIAILMTRDALSNSDGSLGDTQEKIRSFEV